MGAFRGTGKIKIADYASGASFPLRQFRGLSNSSKFEFAFSEEKEELKDYQDPAGGTWASFSRIDVVSGSIDARDFSPENLALALWGTTAALNTTAITGEAHIINAGAFIPTSRLINTSVAPVVKKGATTIDTIDYVVSKGGITIADTITTVGVVDGDSITIDYTPIASTDVQAIISSAPNVSIFFEGVNANDGKYFSAKIYKAKLGVAQNVSLIGDGFGTLSITFTALKDETITGAGLSQYLALEQES